MSTLWCLELELFSGNLFMDQEVILVGYHPSDSLKDNTKAVFVMLTVITERCIPYCFQFCSRV